MFIYKACTNLVEITEQIECYLPKLTSWLFCIINKKGLWLRVTKLGSYTDYLLAKKNCHPTLFSEQSSLDTVTKAALVHFRWRYEILLLTSSQHFVI
jgi:hypothetical protein